MSGMAGSKAQSSFSASLLTGALAHTEGQQEAEPRCRKPKPTLLHPEGKGSTRLVLNISRERLLLSWSVSFVCLGPIVPAEAGEVGFLRWPAQVSDDPSGLQSESLCGAQMLPCDPCVST